MVRKIENTVQEKPEQKTEIVKTEGKKRRGRPRKQPVAASETMTLTLGDVLRHARQSQRMKFPSIAKKLKIKEVYLEALESGHYYKFPALVYGVGFLRSYAKFLGLDADELVRRFRKETMGIRAEPLDMPHNADQHILPSAKTVLKSILALLLLYLAWNFYKIMTYTPFPEPKLPVQEQVTSPEPTSSFPVTVDELIAPKVTEVVAPKEVEKEVVRKEVVAPQRVPQVYGLKQPSRVSFVATGKTWIEIRDTEADSVLLAQDLEAGDRYNPDEDSEGLVLKTTNAGELDVYIDAQKVKTLGKKGQAKAGIPLDAEGLMKE